MLLCLSTTKYRDDVTFFKMGRDFQTDTTCWCCVFLTALCFMAIGAQMPKVTKQKKIGCWDFCLGHLPLNLHTAIHFFIHSCIKLLVKLSHEFVIYNHHNYVWLNLGFTNVRSHWANLSKFIHHLRLTEWYVYQYIFENL